MMRPAWLDQWTRLMTSTLGGKIELELYGPKPPQMALCVGLSGERPHTGEKFSTWHHFGRAIPLESIVIRWDMPDSTLGIFLDGECWFLYRYGPYRRRNRSYWRLPPQPPFTAQEIDHICAKKRRQFRKGA